MLKKTKNDTQSRGKPVFFNFNFCFFSLCLNFEKSLYPSEHAKNSGRLVSLEYGGHPKTLALAAFKSAEQVKDRVCLATSRFS